MMKNRTIRRAWLAGLVMLGIIGLAVAYQVYDRGRPAPISMKRKLYEGVVYRRMVRYSPRLMIAHVVTIDMKMAGFRLFVTPPDHNEGPPLAARTTSQFLEEFSVQVAVNGDGFSPWWSRSPADYYPHAGDPVTPNGYAASGGVIYARGNVLPPEPTMYVSRGGDISFNRIPNRVFHAISGDRMLVLQGEPVPGLDNTELNPRTAIGINKNGRWLYIVVVDGRQPVYSEGATFEELAQLLIRAGAYTAMNLDGGGSSTLVVQGADGKAMILNSPIDNYIPGRERPVANHVGVYVKR